MKQKKAQEKSGTFRRVAEGIVLNASSGSHYARFMFKGKRVMQETVFSSTSLYPPYQNQATAEDIDR